MGPDTNTAFEQRIEDYCTEGDGPAKEVMLMGYLDHPLNNTNELISSNVTVNLSFIKADDKR